MWSWLGEWEEDSLQERQAVAMWAPICKQASIPTLVRKETGNCWGLWPQDRGIPMAAALFVPIGNIATQ